MFAPTRSSTESVPRQVYTNFARKSLVNSQGEGSLVGYMNACLKRRNREASGRYLPMKARLHNLDMFLNVLRGNWERLLYQSLESFNVVQYYHTLSSPWIFPPCFDPCMAANRTLRSCLTSPHNRQATKTPPKIVDVH